MYCPECGWNMERVLFDETSMPYYQFIWYWNGSRPYSFSQYIRNCCTFCGYADPMVK